MTDHPQTDSEYVRVPRIAHVPDSGTPAVTPAAPRISRRRRIAGVGAIASVCGLLAAFAIPLTSPSAIAEPAASAAQPQALFSEVGLEDLPASFAEISATESAQPRGTRFGVRANALVTYPFIEAVTLTDPFGYRTAPVEQFHDAQDFAAAEGTPIIAIADGLVLEAGYASDGCGYGLKLEHLIDGDTVTSRYCHMQMNSHDYAKGDVLLMGDQVGKVGATGMAFGAHLHMAVRVNDKPVDPMPFLTKYSRMDRKPKQTTLPKGASIEDHVEWSMRVGSVDIPYEPSSPNWSPQPDSGFIPAPEPSETPAEPTPTAPPAENPAPTNPAPAPTPAPEPVPETPSPTPAPASSTPTP